jgi:hypothetical protein
MSSENDQSREKTFQVVDKRRFDAHGQERKADTTSTPYTVSPASPGTLQQPSPSHAEPTPQSHQTNTSDAQFTMAEASPGQEEEAVAFTSFIMSLATQVLVQLGEMAPPDGMSIPIDLESARQTIDIMAMLQRRTRGNVSSEEARFMEEVLHSLRVSFINAKKR